MKTKLLTLLSLLIFIHETYSQNLGDTFKVAGITYGITSTGTITSVETLDYDESSGTNITIPSSVTYNNTSYTVTAIGDESFEFNNLTSVVLPNTITEIEEYAFLTNYLTSIDIPESVVIIGGYAFSNNKLESVVIGDNVTTIGEYAFEANSMTELTIGNSVNSIGYFAFAGNSPLTKVTSTSTTPARMPTWAFSIYNDLRKDKIDLFIPAGTNQAYIDANWTGFKSINTQGTLSIKSELLNNLTVTSYDDKLKLITGKKDLTVLNTKIYTISGILVKESKQLVINISSLTNGMYILNIETNKGIINKKGMF